MADKFRGHHIVCTSLYEGKGYSGAFCENMTAVVERLRKDPDEELFLVAEPDMTRYRLLYPQTEPEATRLFFPDFRKTRNFIA